MTFRTHLITSEKILAKGGCLCNRCGRILVVHEPGKYSVGYKIFYVIYYLELLLVLPRLKTTIKFQCGLLKNISNVCNNKDNVLKVVLQLQTVTKFNSSQIDTM
jgi:hypothetical protein